MAPAIAALAAALTPDAASAAVSESWKHATVTAAVRYAAGGTAAALIPSTVAATGRRSFESHELASSDEAGGGPVVDRRRGGRRGAGMLARSAPPEAEQRTNAAADDNRYRTSFKNGATIEVVGVSTVPTGPHTWWKPDGSPLAEAPVDTIERKTSANEARGARVILLRTSGVKQRRHVPVAADPFRLVLGRPALEERSETRRSWNTTKPRSPATGPIARSWRELAAGAWKTEVSNDGRGGTGMFVNGHKFAFGKARPFAAHGRVDDGLRGRPQLLRARQAPGRGRPRRQAAPGRLLLGRVGRRQEMGDRHDRCRIRLAAGPDQGIPGPVPPHRTKP